ncbi:MAG: glycosyl hydrolase family 28-related protein [Pseudomonadota bacterium]
MFDVRDFGAKGDGNALDHGAVNRAIDEATREGGTVRLPAGRYLCFSIRMKSNVTLRLDAGAVIEAADPAMHAGSYDLPEPSEHDVYQDFGHSHWQNSLIWGDGLENVTIFGPGMIHGVGLTRHGPGPRWLKAGSHPNSMAGMPRADMRTLEPARTRMNGQANKAIAFRNCRRVRLDGFTVLKGGHFAILATGVDGLRIEDLRIDTDRDGIDVDACRNVTIADCKVNSPNDDAIVLKASLALGEARATENVTISGCTVSGFDMGTMLDGTHGRTQELSPDRDRVTGRIKLGTESNGSFRNIAITDCSFERCRGLALETVDGGVLENVTVSDLTMREVTTAPLFLRVGDRRRGPEGTGLGAIRRVSISNVTATGIDPRYAASIVGLPDSPIEAVSLSNIRLSYAGGGTAEDAARTVPDARDSYPEPSMFGTLPAHGLYIRDARRLRIDGLTIETEKPDARPALIVERGEDISFTRSPQVTRR